MKVLFAVSNDNTTKAVVSKYQETYKEIITSKNVYYFNAIIKELQRDKTYDAIVIGEDLEPISNNNYEQIDKFLTEKLDNISDEASKPTGEDIPIIFICSDRRNKSDQILRRFFSMSIYNAILGNDRSVTMVCALINKPRNKKEAKKYYQIADTEDAGYQRESNDLVSEEQIQNILSYYKKIGLNEKKCVEAFNSITNQYDDTQLRIIAKFLPISVKAILEANSSKYQKLMTGGTVLSNGQYNKYTAAKKGPNQLDFLEKDLEKPKLTEPVVIPSTMNISNSQIIQNKPTTPQAPSSSPISTPVQKPIQPPIGTNSPAPITKQTQTSMPVNSSIPMQMPNMMNNIPSIDPFAQISSNTPTPNPIETNNITKGDQVQPAIQSNSNQTQVEPVVPNPVEQIAQNPIEPTIPNPIEPIQENAESTAVMNNEFSALDLDKENNNQIEIESEEKRGRGRPRKIYPEENTEVKRKRGRPRKLTPEDEVGNPIASLVTSQVPTQTQIETPTPKEESMDNTSLPIDPFEDMVNNNTNISQDSLESIANNNTNEIQDPLSDISNNSMNPFENNINNTQNVFDSNANNIQNSIGNVGNNVQNPFSNPGTNLMQNQTQDANMSYNGAMAKQGKVAAFVGTTKNGTSFIVNNLAVLLSQNGIKTAVVDLSNNRNAYYMYTNNDAKLMKAASDSLRNLQNGVIQGLEISNTLSIFTSLPDDMELTVNPNTIISNASSKFDIVLLDCDFKTNEDYFTLANEIYLVQSMDAFTIQPLTKFLSDLKMKNKLDENKLRVIVNKNMRLKRLDYKMIIGGMSKYNEPSMTLQRDLFNPQTVKAIIIPFEEANYAKYIESIAMCQLNLNGYTKALIQSLEELKNMVYPLVAGNFGRQDAYFGSNIVNNQNRPMYGNYQPQNTKPKRSLFGSRKQNNIPYAQSPMAGNPNNPNNQFVNNQNNQFSNNMNNTLNKMRNY